jgi:dTDP-4-amino-4,6-dideoxygalactose transaminase
METIIPFNKPYYTGKETVYIKEAVRSGKISGDGMFTKKCHDFFEHEMGFKKALLTTSCTDALEMAAILINIKPGDEIIMPSYTFVSTSNAFVLRGAKIVFIDSCKEHPGMDAALIEDAITPLTKAIVPVHYAGVACDMDKIMSIAIEYKLFVIEDAAQAIDSFYTNKLGQKIRLGSIGHLAAMSFHETKNIISGEGGLLIINDSKFISRAEIIREKGTNRSAFFRGEIDKYGWVDIGSSFLPSDIIAAFLFAQLEKLRSIQNKRNSIWKIYHYEFSKIKGLDTLFSLPHIPEYATNNSHMYYLICKTPQIRHKFISFLKENNIHAVFHYLSLHKSSYYLQSQSGESELPLSDKYTEQLVRLPIYPDLTKVQINKITSCVKRFVNEFC